MPYSLKSILETRLGEVLLSKLTSSLLFTYQGNVYMLSGVVNVALEDEEWSYIDYNGDYYDSQFDKTSNLFMRFGIERTKITVSGEEHVEINHIHRHDE